MKFADNIFNFQDNSQNALKLGIWGKFGSLITKIDSKTWKKFDHVAKTDKKWKFDDFSA